MIQDFEMQKPAFIRTRELYERREKLSEEIRIIEASPDFITEDRWQFSNNFTSNFFANFLYKKKR